MVQHGAVLKTCAKVHRVVLLVCLVMIIQNSVTIFRQSCDIYQKSATLRRKRLAWLANDTLSNNSLRNRYFTNNETEKTEENLNQWNMTEVVENEIIRKDQQVITVTEGEIAQLAKHVKNEDPTLNGFLHKNQGTPVHTRTNFTPVLILAYLRSGSSWLGDMIRQSDETFYVFEPFKPYQHQSYYKVGSVCFNNNTCRASDIPTDRHGFVLFTLEQLFNCRFERVAPKILSHMTHGLHEGTQMVFTQCVKAVHNSTKCLNYLKRKCFESSHRVIKTIRISMSVVAKLVDLVPDLKVIHLLRDPRAITNSRRKGHFGMAFDIISHSKDMCKRMDEDLNAAENLKVRYRRKIVTVIYEALAEYPDTGIQFLYNFLQLPLDENTLSWMDMSSSGSVNNGYYKTYRKDSAQIAQRWRSKVTFNITRIIDSYCGPVYSYVGYVAIKSEYNLNDINYITRKTNPQNDDSWFQ